MGARASSITGQLPRQSSVPNSLLVKARKIQAELQQIEEIEQQDQFVLTEIVDVGGFYLGKGYLETYGNE
jgi:hypothetical protein